MILSELYKFGKQVDIPYGFTLSKKLDFLITITINGEFVDVSPIDKTEKLLTLSTIVRTGKNYKSNFLHDKIEYVSGRNTSNKTQEIEKQHLVFVNRHKELQERCKNIYVNAINLFYENGGAKKLNDELDSKNFKKISGWVGFRINDGNNYVRPHEDQNLINFFSNFLLEETTLSELGQCSITGKLNQPLISVTAKQFSGFENISGGLSVYSNNFSSVVSFGLKQLESSCISQDADLKITNALDYLLNNKNHNYKLIGHNKAYVFWTDEAINSQFDPFKYLDNKINIEDIASFVSSWKLNKNKIDKISDVNCYLIEINTNTQRPLFTFCNFKESQLKNNLEKWFDNIESENCKFRFFSLENLAETLYKTSDCSKKTKEVLSKKIKKDLFDMMFFNKTSSKYLKVQINKEILRLAGPFENNERKKLSHEKIALINCCLGYSNMEIKNHAYNYGKILAFADYLQNKALDKVNVSTSQKFYRGNNPQKTFKELDYSIKLYIDMIKRDKNKKGSVFFFEGKYNELISNLELPLKFNDDEQLLKAKGFYEERLSNKKSQSDNNENEIIN
jgi:hypothetical protein